MMSQPVLLTQSMNYNDEEVEEDEENEEEYEEEDEEVLVEDNQKNFFTKVVNTNEISFGGGILYKVRK
jgi:hypothetical protein